MQAITAIFLNNSLRAILDHIEQTPDLDPGLPGLIEFKETLIAQIHQIQQGDPRRGSKEGREAA